MQQEGGRARTYWSENLKIEMERRVVTEVMTRYE